MKYSILLLILLNIPARANELKFCQNFIASSGIYDQYYKENKSKDKKTLPALGSKMIDLYNARIKRGDYKLNDKPVPNEITEKIKKLEKSLETALCKDYSSSCMGYIHRSQKLLYKDDKVFYGIGVKHGYSTLRNSLNACRGICGDWKKQMDDIWSSKPREKYETWKIDTLISALSKAKVKNKCSEKEAVALVNKTFSKGEKKDTSNQFDGADSKTSSQDSPVKSNVKAQ